MLVPQSRPLALNTLSSTSRPYKSDIDTTGALFGVVVGNVVGRGAARGHRGRAGALGNAAAPHCAEVAGSGIPSGNPETAKADNAWAKRFLKAAEALDHPSEPGGYYCRGLQ
jgi:hypothetical protein